MGYLESDEHAVCLAHNTDGDGALLDSLQRILDLEDSALRGAIVSISYLSGRTTRTSVALPGTHKVTESLS